MLQSLSVTSSLRGKTWTTIPILVEESCGERDSLHDKLQVLDALALLFESHGATVIDVNDNIVESKSRNVSCVSLGNIVTCLLT